MQWRDVTTLRSLGLRLLHAPREAPKTYLNLQLGECALPNRLGSTQPLCFQQRKRSEVDPHRCCAPIVLQNYARVGSRATM
jgi:hypothetical protein